MGTLSWRIQNSTKMDDSMGISIALDRYEKRISNQIGDSFKIVIQDINENMKKLIDMTVNTAETLDQYINEETNILIQLLSQGPLIKEESLAPGKQLTKRPWKKEPFEQPLKDGYEQEDYNDEQPLNGSGAWEKSLAYDEDNITSGLDDDRTASLGELANMDAQEFMDDMSTKEQTEEKVEPKKKKGPKPKEEGADSKQKPPTQTFSLDDFRVKVPLDKVKVRSPNEPKPIYTCEHCPYKTERRHTLTRHVKTIHEENRPFVCNQCGRPYALRDHLKDHMKRKHNVIFEPAPRGRPYPKKEASQLV